MFSGQIIKALSGFYYVRHNAKTIQCRGRGIFRNRKISPLVGDHVIFQIDQNDEGTILEIEDRKNEMIRPPIANIDQVILVFSAVQPDFNPYLLDRFLVLVESKQIQPVICISKIDLIPQVAKSDIDQFERQYTALGYEVKQISTKSEDGLSDIKSLFSNKISVFAGQSGVGKTSILNLFDPSTNRDTGEISMHLGRGRHTTRHVELVEIGDGYLADTPGFSSLELDGIEATDLGSCFPEMRQAQQDCKFRGCLHHKEPGCKVREQVETGEIQAYRYEHYIKFLNEIFERKPRY